jgi:hypothetical protein
MPVSQSTIDRCLKNGSHVRCEVEYHHGAWLVAFQDGTDLLLQSDYDQAAFAVACGAVDAPRNWDGQPSTLPYPQQFYDMDCSDIYACPDCYHDIAEQQDNQE